MRAKSGGPARLRRRKRMLKLAEGFRGRRKNCLRRAMEAVNHSLANATRDRKQRKRQFRRLWITRINAATRMSGMSYSTFIAGLKRAGVTLDRKVMAEIAYYDSATFAALVETAKAA